MNRTNEIESNWARMLYRAGPLCREGTRAETSRTGVAWRRAGGTGCRAEGIQRRRGKSPGALRNRGRGPRVRRMIREVIREEAGARSWRAVEDVIRVWTVF